MTRCVFGRPEGPDPATDAIHPMALIVMRYGFASEGLPQEIGQWVRELIHNEKKSGQSGRVLGKRLKVMAISRQRARLGRWRGLRMF